MRKEKKFFKSIALIPLLGIGITAGGIAQENNKIVIPEPETPVILSTSPAAGAENIDLNSVIEITFSSDMDESTINGTTFLLHATYEEQMSEEHGEILHDQIRDRSAVQDSENSGQFTSGAVYGTIRYSDKVAVFTPDRELKENAQYTFTVTSGVKSSENISLDMDQSWSFTTRGTSDATLSDKQDDGNRYGTEENEPGSMFAMSTNKSELIDLGKAGNFVILAKENVSNESGSKITGQVGEGSEANSTKKESDVYKTTRQKDANQASVMQPSPRDSTSSDVSEAIDDMITAYSSVSSQNGEKAQHRDDRGNDNDENKHQNRDQDSDEVTTHKDDHIPDEVLKPGVHQWSKSLNVHSDFTLSGSEDDVWLFKVSEDLTVDEDFVLTLSDGAQADNIFWYVEGEVTIGKNAQFEGVILSMNEITLEKGAKLNGRMFSQASITLDDNTVTEPRSMNGRTTSTNK